MIAMIPAAKMPELIDPEHSCVSRPRKVVATTPNQAGTKQQTSFRLIGKPVAFITFQIVTEVICMPG